MSESVMINNLKRESLLKNPNFLLLFFGGIVSRIGNGIHHIGLVWYIMELHNSGLAVGTILMLATIPGVILGPFSGVLVDRFDRKKIIIWMDIIRGVIVLLMSLMIITGTMNYTFLILGTVLLSICGTLFNPAVSASIPNIVKNEHLSKANSLEHLSMNLTGVIGPAVGGVMIAIWGVGGVFMINGISFLLSAFSEYFIKFPPQKKNYQTEKIHFITEMKEGVSFLYQQKALFYLLFTCLFANFFFAGSSVVGLPLVVRNSLQGSVQDFGLIEAAWPVGAILGGLLLSLLPEFKKVFKPFTIALSVQTVFWTLIGCITLPEIIATYGISLIKYAIIACLILGGVCNAFVNVPLMVVFQRMVPDEKRGRIFGITMTISQGLVPIAIGLSGIVSDLVLPSYLFIIGGLGMFILMLNFVRKKEVRLM